MLDLLLQTVALLFFFADLLLQVAFSLLALVEFLLMLFLLSGEGLPLFALLGKKVVLLIALPLKVEVKVGKTLFATLDGSGLVTTEARILLEILHFEVGVVIACVVEKERGGIDILAKAIERADDTCIFGLHAVNLAANHPQGVFRAGDLTVEMSHLTIDVVNKSVALVDALFDEFDLLCTVARIFTGFAQFVVEARYFFLDTGFIAFELFFALRLRRLGKQQQCDEQQQNFFHDKEVSSSLGYV